MGRSSSKPNTARAKRIGAGLVPEPLVFGYEVGVFGADAVRDRRRA